jgi:hypothetical protein
MDKNQQIGCFVFFWVFVGFLALLVCVVRDSNAGKTIEPKVPVGTVVKIVASDQTGLILDHWYPSFGHETNNYYTYEIRVEGKNRGYMNTLYLKRCEFTIKENK